RHRARTQDDAGSKPAIKWNGRGIRQNDEARLRPRLAVARRQNRNGNPAFVDRALQQPSSAQGARLSFTPRVHRGSNPTLIVSDHSGATTNPVKISTRH